MATKVIPTLTIGDKKWYEEIFQLYYALGIKFIRINLTRFPLEEYRRELMIMKEVQHNIWGKEELKLLLDVPYPGTKARICFDGNENKVYVKKNEHIYISGNKKKMNIEKKFFFVEENAQIYNEKRGTLIEIDDGKLNFSLISNNAGLLTLKAENSGYIKYMKSINSKGNVYYEEERETFKLYLKEIIAEVQPYGVIFSFLNTAEKLLEIIKDFGGTIEIIPKIETPEAVNNLHLILQHCKTVLLGRGDLLLTSNLSVFALLQEQVIELCKSMGKEVMIATDIMTSNISDELSLPLRSDLIDLDNIVKNAIDYIVTSGEMGQGRKLKDMLVLIEQISKVRNV